MTTTIAPTAAPAHAARPNNAWYRMLSALRALELTPNAIAEGERLAEADLDFVERALPLTPDSRILEIGCGWGRHTLHLARRGYRRVVSLDIAPAMLAIARRRADAAGLTPTIVEADYIDLAPDAPFDAVLSLYDRSLLGWPTETEDRASLAHLARLIRPGGALLFGIRDWPVDLPRPSRDWRETPLGLLLEETLPDAAAMTCARRSVLIHPDGRREEQTLTRRHYSLPEVRRLLDEAGFAMLAAYHAFDEQRPYGREEQGLVVLARREEGGR
jgi:SAM-dependent methyltransferase